MKVNFLLAEDVRPEVSNKLTILGLFPGEVVILQKGARPEGVPEDAPAGLERLAILVTISDTEGPHKYKGRVVEPSGELYKPEIELGNGISQKGFSHTVIVALRPFIVKQPGIFHFEFFVDDEIFSFPFEIREQVAPAS